MPDGFTGFVGPVLALTGTLAAALLGYRQWKKQQDLARFGSFLSERQTAYKVLWQKLEAAHLYVRSESFDEEAYREIVRAANTHLIAVGLLLDRGEKARVNEYLSALSDLGRLLAESAASAEKDQVQRTLHDTATIPQSLLTQVRGLEEAYRAVERQREILIEHFRHALGAHLFT